MPKKSVVKDFEIWQTGISQSFCCHLQEKNIDEAFEPCVENYLLEDSKQGNSPIFWFDRMLRGGIKVPETCERPLTFLFTGPPGTGKSTLALELCYRLAKNEYQLPGRKFHLLNEHGPKNCFYLSTETTSSQALQKATSLGWEDTAIFKNYTPTLYKNMQKGSTGNIVLFGAEIFKKRYDLGKMIFDVLKKSLPILKIIAKGIPGTPAQMAAASVEVTSEAVNIDPSSLNSNLTAISRDNPNAGSVNKYANQLMSDIIVIDSLNCLPSDKSRERIFNSFINKLSGHTKIVIFILDSESNSTEHKFWEYVCDNVIRMDADSHEGYYKRTIEIIKARYQQHVLGKQVFKIFPTLLSTGQNNKGDLAGVLPCHTHPYRKEGGFFIYPSIHYYLSRYKRHLSKPSESNKDYAKTYPNELNSLIAPNRGLMPEGRCTAFLGVRGGHKSHLGYLHLLYRMIVCKESTIVVSLRDDEEMTRKSMVRILGQQEELIKKAENDYAVSLTKTLDAKKIITDLEKNGRLQILYYHPGYITPEEFCHRILVSIKHIKRDGEELVKKDMEEGKISQWNKITLLFNSLDQIPSRFPLCAKQDIFVPGLVDVLNGEDVTSIFVAVETPDQPIAQFGLLPMADLVLSFKPYWFKQDQYDNTLKKSFTRSKTFNMHEAIVLQVLRFAGGEMAGAKGILELVPSEHSDLLQYYSKVGLHFTPLDRDWFPYSPSSVISDRELKDLQNDQIPEII